MKDDKLAVLIDADNVPYANIREMLVEIAKYGNPTIKRIYADWTKPSLSGWKNVLLENAITPIQQYSYTQGKNSSDSALIIDAMDLLYAKKVSGFCIVSSDSDFTRLATRLREAGMFVMGFGEKKTPKPFITACDKFIYIENFRTYYLRYLGDDGSESLKRISINEKNTKTAILTVPMADFPSYFSLFDCKSDSAKEPIQVEWSDDPFKKIS